MQTISFRTKVDSTDYGFDFELFDKIIPERCKQIPKNDYVVLYLEKEHQIESSSFQKQWIIFCILLNTLKHFKSSSKAFVCFPKKLASRKNYFSAEVTCPQKYFLTMSSCFHWVFCVVYFNSKHLLRKGFAGQNLFLGHFPHVFSPLKIKMMQKLCENTQKERKYISSKLWFTT